MTSRRRFGVPFGALVGSQVLYGRLPAERLVGATRGIVLLMLGTAAVEAADARGPRAGLAPMAAAGAIGFGAELLGTTTGRPFGHYHYSERLGPRVRGVPVLAAAAWAMMSRPSWVVAGTLSDRAVLRVPLAAAALTAWDVFLDPRMVRDGYWTWPGGGRYEGVPATNFVGWWMTGLAVFSAFAALDREPAALSGPSDAAGVRWRRDDGALALYTWTWIGESFANAVLWRRPRVAAAGAAAMGLSAVPALWRRLRAAPAADA